MQPKNPDLIHDLYITLYIHNGCRPTNENGDIEINTKLCSCDPDVGYVCEHCHMDGAIREAIDFIKEASEKI